MTHIEHERRLPGCVARQPCKFCSCLWFQIQLPFVIDDLDGPVRGSCGQAVRSRKKMRALPNPASADRLRPIVTLPHRDQPEEPTAHHLIHVRFQVGVTHIGTVAKPLKLLDGGSIPRVRAALNVRIGKQSRTCFPDDFSDRLSLSLRGVKEKADILILPGNVCQDIDELRADRSRHIKRVPIGVPVWDRIEQFTAHPRSLEKLDSSSQLRFRVRSWSDYFARDQRKRDLEAIRWRGQAQIFERASQTEKHFPEIGIERAEVTADVRVQLNFRIANAEQPRLGVERVGAENRGMDQG